VPDGEVAKIAILNEFGTRTAPERPAFRNVMRANRSKYLQAMRAGVRAVIAAAVRGGDVAAMKHSVLARLGAMAEGDLKAGVTSLDSPPNAPSTIRKKGSSKPLVDTGRLRASVTHEVEDE
jgi:hypothetical protein